MNFFCKGIWVGALFCFGLTGCFKASVVNQSALIHQKACIESLEFDDYSRAKIHCELCLEYDNSMPECLNGLGLCALANKDEERAKGLFVKALRQDNDFVHARNNLGVIYFLNKDFKTANRYFLRALEIDPSCLDARYNMALSQLRLGQRMVAKNLGPKAAKYFLDAKMQIKKLLAQEPKFKGAYKDLGIVELNLFNLSEFKKERDEALFFAYKAFKQCLALTSDDDGCYEGLAQVHSEKGLYDKALTNYFLCLAHNPKNSHCRANIAGCYEKSAQAKGGFNQFALSLKDSHSNAMAHEALCASLFESGMIKEAVTECKLSLQLKPDFCPAQFRLAEYYAAVFDAENAGSFCQEFLQCSNEKDSTQFKKCQEILANLKY